VSATGHEVADGISCRWEQRIYLKEGWIIYFSTDKEGTVHTSIRTSNGRAFLSIKVIS
jgi:hypothetical protein